MWFMNYQVNQTIINQVQINYTNIPLAIFLIGANGSGKSTLRNYLNLSDIQMNIDPDLLNRIFKVKYPNNYLVEAAKQALTMYNQALRNNLNLCIESTLSGKGTMQRIIAAKKQGYFVIGYFVGLNNVELNLQRIRERVKQGGHDILENIVRRRYTESIDNFLQIKDHFDIIHFIDNSGDCYKLQFSIEDQQVIMHDNILEAWAERICRLW